MTRILQKCSIVFCILFLSACPTANHGPNVVETPNHTPGPIVDVPEVKQQQIIPLDDTLGGVALVLQNNEPILYQVTGPHRSLTAYKLLEFTPDSIGQLAVEPENPIVLTDLKVIGSGGQNKVYDYEGNTVLRAFKPANKGEAAALIKMLKLQQMKGIVKIQRILKASDGEIAVVFEKLSRKNLAIEHMSEVEFAQIAERLAELLTELNLKGAWHGDISQNNIMFRGDEPVLIDFPSDGATTYGESDAKDLGTSLIIMRLRSHYKNLLDGLVKKVYFKLNKNKELTSFLFEHSSYEFTGTAHKYFNQRCYEKSFTNCYIGGGKRDDYIIYRKFKLLVENFKKLFEKPEGELEKLSGITSEIISFDTKLYQDRGEYKISLIAEHVKSLIDDGTFQDNVVSELKPLERSLYNLKRHGDIVGFQTTISKFLKSQGAP